MDKTFTNETGTYQPEQRIDGNGNPYTVNLPVPKTITSGAIAPATILQGATPPKDTNNYPGIIAGVAGNIDNLTGAYNTATTDKKTTETGILSVMDALAGKAADTNAAYSTPGGVNDIFKTLTDLGAQAKSLQNEASAIPIQTQEKNKNTGATDVGVAPQNAGALRLNALKALSIGQQADIASANYTAAKNKADQMIELKYKPQEDKLAMLKQQYEFNKDNLGEIDKKRTEALGLAIKKEEQNIADLKTKETAKNAIALEAAKNGAKPDALATIAGIDVNDKDYYNKALNAAKGFLTDPQEKTLKNLQIKALIEKNQQTNDDLKVIADSIINGDQPPVLTGLYSKSAGVRAELARKGYNLVKAQADWDALKKFTAANNSPAQVRMKQAESSVELSLGNLEKYNQELDRTGFKFVNKAEMIAASNGLMEKKYPGSTAAAQGLIGQIALITDELGQTFMGGNSPTDAAFGLAAKVLDSDFSKDTLTKQIGLIKTNLQYRKNSWATVQATGLGGMNQYTQNDPLGVGITNNTSVDPLGLGI